MGGIGSSDAERPAHTRDTTNQADTFKCNSYYIGWANCRALLLLCYIFATSEVVFWIKCIYNTLCFSGISSAFTCTCLIKYHAPWDRIHYCLSISQNNIIAFSEKGLAAQARQRQDKSEENARLLFSNKKDI